MSCNTKTSLAAVIDAVNAQLNNNYIDRDDPRINQGVFTEPTIRGGLMLDESAKLDFCGFVRECGLEAPFGKQWVDRPLYPDNVLYSVDDGTEITPKWVDINDVVSQDTIDAQVTTTPIDGSLGEASNQLAKNRERVSVQDFFTHAERVAYEENPKTFDCHRPLQEFFTYIALNNVGVAHCDISCGIGSGVTMGVKGNSETKVVMGSLHLAALNPIDIIISREIGQNFTWEGSIILEGHVSGGNWYVWRNRTCRIGISTHPTYENARQRWGYIRCSGFQQHGLNILGKNTASEYRYVRGTANGVGHSPREDYRLTSTFTAKVDSGSSGSGAQTSKINVLEMPPEIIVSETNSYIVFNDEYYLIKERDYSNSTLVVTPWLPLDVDTGTFSYCFGGNVSVRGGDSSALKFGYIEGTNNGINYNDTALYGANVGAVMSQACGVGINIGGELGSANLGGYVGTYYAEGNNADLLLTSTTLTNRVIANCHTVQTKKVFVISPRLVGSGNYNTRTLGKLSMRVGASILTGRKTAVGSNSEIFVDPFSVEGSWLTHLHNKPKCMLPEIDFNAYRLTGLNSTSFKVMGARAKNLPDNATFILDSAAKAASTTINGSSEDLVFSGFSEIPEFTVYADVPNNNYIVSCKGLAEPVVTPPQTTVAYDFESLEAASQQSTTVSLEGVKLGDMVAVSIDKPLQGTRIWAEVTATGVVTVYHRNDTDAPVDLASSNLTVKLL